MDDTKRQNEKETPEERRRRMRRKRLIQERRRRRRRKALILRGILVILFVLILVGIGSAVSCGVKQYNRSAKKKDSGKQETQIEEEPVQLESVDLTNVLYLSFESLIADADQAFGQENTRAAATLDQTRVTVDEFNAILEQLYEDGYILVRFSDLAAVNEDGVMEAKELMLPSGKKPLLLSETNVNYDLKLSGQGLASKLVLDENGWTQVRTGDGVDIYVFAYGNDYKEALNDFYRLTGKTPMLPRYALGNWWSRYYAYTEDSYKALVTRFEKEKIPFSVGVLDMDWHLVEEVDPKYGSGWTGYTWNKKYYPDPERFMNWLHDHGMKISVNLHPAGGIRAFEEAYPAMAKELGDVDTEHEAPIDFDITSRKFLEAYFKCVLHPEENKGVDFWWIDWQQGNITKVPGLDPLWMLNHYHYLDNARDGKRPLTFSRYAGPGSHRYPVGFSGDSIVTWESLNFQPYFTSTASNIGYGWWSHDIGGHMLGYRDNELALRWVQLGVFSPINRLHSSKNEFMGKEPWQFPMEIGEVMKAFLRLRHQMLPYLYTMNYRAYKENTPLILPMYYTYPAEQVAYTVKNEYEYGTAFIVAPVTEKSVQGVGRARTHVWLPEGTYIDFFTGLVYSGDREMDMYRDLHSIPVLAKAGAIVPMTEEIFGQEAARNPETMTIRVYGGADGSFQLYEDDNESNAYLKDECVLTDMDLKWSIGRFVIHKAAGRLELIPQKRTWTVEFWGVKDAEVTVEVEGTGVEASKEYDEALGCLKISVPETSATAEIIITLGAPELRENDVKTQVFTLLNQAEIPYMEKTAIMEILDKKISNAAKLTQLTAMHPEEGSVGAVGEILTAIE